MYPLFTPHTDTELSLSLLQIKIVLRSARELIGRNTNRFVINAMMNANEARRL